MTKAKNQETGTKRDLTDAMDELLHQTPPTPDIEASSLPLPQTTPVKPPKIASQETALNVRLDTALVDKLRYCSYSERRSQKDIVQEALFDFFRKRGMV